MEAKYKEVMEQMYLSSKPMQAGMIGWDCLDTLFGKLLSKLFERKIQTELKRSDYYEWDVKICNTALSADELEIILELINALPNERELCMINDEVVEIIPKKIAQKLFSQILPFPVFCSHAADEGIWFIGRQDLTKTGETYKFVLSNHETENLDINKLYRLSAEKLGVNQNNPKLRFDCRKIKVAPNIMDIIIQTHTEKYIAVVGEHEARNQACMEVCQVGPKKDEILVDFIVEIEHGFIIWDDKESKEGADV